MLSSILYVFSRVQKLRRSYELLSEGGTNTCLPVLSLTLERYHCPLCPDFLRHVFYHTFGEKWGRQENERTKFLFLFFFRLPWYRNMQLCLLDSDTHVCFFRCQLQRLPSGWKRLASGLVSPSLLQQRHQRPRKKKAVRQNRRDMSSQATHQTAESHWTLWISDDVFLKASRDASVRWQLVYIPQILTQLILLYQSSRILQFWGKILLQHIIV